MKASLLVLALALVATTSWASGIDLSFHGCPGNPGVTGGEYGTLDCAGSPA